LNHNWSSQKTNKCLDDAEQQYNAKIVDVKKKIKNAWYCLTKGIYGQKCGTCNYHYNFQGKFITKCIENFSEINTVNYNSGSVPGAEKRQAVERQKLKDKQTLIKVITY